MREDQALRAHIEDVLDHQVRPYLQSHGGDVEIVSIIASPTGADIVTKLRAACRHCELRTVTFAATVRSKLVNIAGVRRVTCEGITLSESRLDRIQDFFAD